MRVQSCGVRRSFALVAAAVVAANARFANAQCNTVHFLSNSGREIFKYDLEGDSGESLGTFRSRNALADLSSNQLSPVEQQVFTLKQNSFQTFARLFRVNTEREPGTRLQTLLAKYEVLDVSRLAVGATRFLAHSDQIFVDGDGTFVFLYYDLFENEAPPCCTTTWFSVAMTFVPGTDNLMWSLNEIRPGEFDLLLVDWATFEVAFFGTIDGLTPRGPNRRSATLMADSDGRLFMANQKRSTSIYEIDYERVIDGVAPTPLAMLVVNATDTVSRVIGGDFYCPENTEANAEALTIRTDKLKSIDMSQMQETEGFEAKATPFQ